MSYFLITVYLCNYFHFSQQFVEIDFSFNYCLLQFNSFKGSTVGFFSCFFFSHQFSGSTFVSVYTNSRPSSLAILALCLIAWVYSVLNDRLPQYRTPWGFSYSWRFFTSLLTSLNDIRQTLGIGLLYARLNKPA